MDKLEIQFYYDWIGSNNYCIIRLLEHYARDLQIERLRSYTFQNEVLLLECEYHLLMGASNS